MRFGIVLSQFNKEYTEGLLAGAEQFFKDSETPFNRETDLILAPGAFELPLIAQRMAKTGKYDGIVCLGCLIKGDTAHFEFISLGVTVGIMQSMLNCEVPISFGVITTYNDEQASVRSVNNTSNKGYEAAKACWETASILRQI